MRSIVRDYPLWPKGHGALYDLHLFLGNFAEAEYHLRQLIALQPAYEYAVDLAEQEAELLTGRLLVVHDHGAQVDAHASKPPAGAASGISRRATVPRPGSLRSSRPAWSP